MSDDLPEVHRGKVGSFPPEIREEINRRLHDGQSASKILPWLNAEPAVIERLRDRWEGNPVTAQNLSEWRRGGYRIWQRRREKSQHLQSLTSWAASMADQISAKKLSDAGRVILAGNILEVMEGMEAQESVEAMADAFAKIASSVDSSEMVEINRDKLELRKDQHELASSRHDLDREKFEILAVQKFREWAENSDALAVLKSGEPEADQIKQLRAIMFGPAAADQEGKSA
jgi:hypothetical protein